MIAALLERAVPARIMARLGARCVTVPTYLAARSRGDVSVETAFFSGLRLRSGVFKTTGSERLDDTVPWLVAQVGWPAGSPLRVLDVACSSGESTVTLHAGLRAAGFQPTTTGTDILTAATYVARDNGTGVLFDPAHQPIQVDVGDWAASWYFPPRKIDLVRRPHRVARAYDILARQVALYRTALHTPVPGMTVTPVPLVSSTVDDTSGVTVIQEDLEHPSHTDSVDIIRAANILNLVYFPEDRLRAMIRSVAGRLSEGGVLFVVRSDPGGNQGSLVRRTGLRLASVTALNGGSEIAHLLHTTTLTR